MRHTQTVRSVVVPPLPEVGRSKPSDGSIEKAATGYVGEVTRQARERDEKDARE